MKETVADLYLLGGAAVQAGGDTKRVDFGGLVIERPVAVIPP